MWRYFLLGAIGLGHWTAGSVLSAQTTKWQVPKAVQIVNSQAGSSSDILHAVTLLKSYQDDGKDISAASPGLRKIVSQSVDWGVPHGVNGNVDNALLCLMRIGDTQAIGHYLKAQETYFRRTGRPMKFEGNGEGPYLMAIDTAHHDRAVVLLKKYLPGYRAAFYQRGTGRNNYPFLLAWLARFSEDKIAMVAEVNAAWKQHLAHRDMNQSSGTIFNYFIPAVCLLADQPGLLPDLLAEMQLDSNPQLETYGILLATLAPFQSSARSQLKHWLTATNSETLRECWITAYVDSACRLPEAERQQAYAHLTRIAKPIYDQVKPIHHNLLPLVLLNAKPTFTDSEYALIEETQRAFGEGKFLHPEEYKHVLDLQSGLGTSY